MGQEVIIIVGQHRSALLVNTSLPRHPACRRVVSIRARTNLFFSREKCGIHVLEMADATQIQDDENLHFCWWEYGVVLIGAAATKPFSEREEQARGMQRQKIAVVFGVLQ